MSAWIDATVDFIARNQAWAPWLVLILATLETTAVLSLIVPSTAILAAVGALTATGAIQFTPLWIGASAGAILGSFFSFWLGRRYGGVILASRPLNRYPEWIERADNAFARWGPATIFAGHFASILRPFVFLMAGMCGMTLFRFAFWNVLGCLAWAWAIPKFGELGGHLVGWLWVLLAS